MKQNRGNNVTRGPVVLLTACPGHELHIPGYRMVQVGRLCVVKVYRGERRFRVDVNEGYFLRVGYFVRFNHEYAARVTAIDYDRGVVTLSKRLPLREGTELVYVPIHHKGQTRFVPVKV